MCSPGRSKWGRRQHSTVPSAVAGACCLLLNALQVADAGTTGLHCASDTCNHPTFTPLRCFPAAAGAVVAVAVAPVSAPGCGAGGAAATCKETPRCPQAIRQIQQTSDIWRQWSSRRTRAARGASSSSADGRCSARARAGRGSAAWQPGSESWAGGSTDT